MEAEIIKFQIHLCGVYIADIIIRQEYVYIGSITSSSRGIYTTSIMWNYTGICRDNVSGSYVGTFSQWQSVTRGFV